MGVNLKFGTSGLKLTHTEERFYSTEKFICGARSNAFLILL
jgi:hypothetical protein